MEPATPSETPKRQRARVGTAVHVMGEATDLLEQLCDASLGEVTPEVAAAEAWQQLKVGEAVEALARFERFCSHGLGAVKAERERLTAVEERIKSRRTWCHDRIREILETEGRASFAAGAFRVTSTAGRWHVEAEKGLDAKDLPAEVRRWVDSVPGMWVLDKKAAGVELGGKDSFPIKGLHRVQGQRSVKVQ